MSENEEGRRSPSPIAGPSRSPLVASNDVLPAPTLSPHPATSSSSKLPSQLSKPSANDLSTGWHRFMSLLNELSPTQRLSFTAEILTLESYLAGRLKREAAQLDGMINPQLAASIMSTNTEDSTTISNVEEVEKSVDELLRSVGLNRLYEDELARTKRESREESRAASRSKVVHIDGLPFLLEVPLNYKGDDAAQARDAIRASRQRHDVLQNIVRTMIIALRTLASPFPHAPHSHAPRHISMPARPAQLPVANGLPPPLPAPAQPPAAGQVGRAFAVVINLDELFRTIVPLLFLSLKLAFLLWIFGKHASPTKRTLLGCLAVVWVIYEAWNMRTRRAQEARRAREREREEINRAARRRRGDVTPAAVGLPAGDPLAPPNQADAQAAARRARRNNPRNVMTPRFWIHAVAAIGLNAEAREMGIVRHAQDPSRRIPAEAPPRTFVGRAKRAWRQLVVGLVLFFGTLVPEVEKRRKRLLEKRERVRAQVEAERNAQLAAAAAAVVPMPTVQPVDAPATQPSGHSPSIPNAPFHGVGHSLSASSSSSSGATEVPPVPTIVEPPTVAGEIPPAADETPLLAPPTPDIGSDDEDEPRVEGDVDEVGMILF